MTSVMRKLGGTVTAAGMLGACLFGSQQEAMAVTPGSTSTPAAGSVCVYSGLAYTGAASCWSSPGCYDHANNPYLLSISNPTAYVVYQVGGANVQVGSYSAIGDLRQYNGGNSVTGAICFH